MFGRNGEAPLPIICPRSPSDCFDVAQEAWRIASKFMIPVMLLSDGYIANGSEPWRIPEASELAKDQDRASGVPPTTANLSCPISAMRTLRGRGPFPGRPD